nr:PKD-like domain-containing protein [Cesiribacter andamanensis]
MVRVNPSPVLSSSLSPNAVCSGTNFSYTATSATAGATFTWTRPAVAGITSSSPASGTSAGTGTQNLVNTTTAPIDVTYKYRVTANGCQGPEQNVVIRVNPRPQLSITLSPAAICSGTTFAYTPTSETPGATFTWTRILPTGLSGPNPSSGSGAISQTLTNNTPNPLTAIYRYTTTANTCTGTSTQDVAVVVNPNPILSSTLTPPAICTGNSFTYSPTSATGGASFSWSRVAVTGISNPAANGTGPISEQLVNTTTSPIDVTYQITTTANGCPGTPQNLVVRVNPYPVAEFSGITDGGITYSGESSKVLTGSPAGGTFSGPGVSLAQGIWRFNACTALGSADELEVPITYTVTEGGCTSTITKNVLVKRSTYTVINRGEPFTICRGQNITFTAYIYREVEVMYPYTNTPITDVGIRDAATYNEAYTDYYRALIKDPDWEPSDIERAYPQRLLQPIPYNPDAGDDLEDQVDVAQFLMDPALFSYQWERNGSDQGQDNQSRSIAALSATDYIRVKVELRNQSSCITSTQPLITGPKGEKWAPSNYLFFSEPRDYVLILPDNTPPLAICQGDTEGVQVSFPVGTYQWINTNTEITWFLRRDGIVYPLYTIDLSNATQDQLAGYFTLTADELNQALSDRYPQLVPGELIDGDEVYMEYISDLDREIRSRCSQGGQVNASQVVTVIVNNLEAEAEPFEEEICLGETITVQNLEITTLTGTNEVSYQWYINGQLYTQATGPTFDFTPSSATPGTYEIEVTLTNGCQTISALAIGTLTVNPLPEVTLGNLSVCVLNAPITLTTGSSNITAGSGTYSGPGITNGVFDPSEVGPGTYTYTYTFETTNGCLATETATITVEETIELEGELLYEESPDGQYWTFTAEESEDLDFGDNPTYRWLRRTGISDWEEVYPQDSRFPNVYLDFDYGADVEIIVQVVNSEDCTIIELIIPNNPLPVDMLYFRATKQGADAVLEWATAKEENNTGFEVQVSTNGTEYRKLAFVPTADGNTTGTQTYKYTDREKGKAGNRYYRLMQIDIDGTTEYFGPQLVQFETRDGLTFYPNPFQNEIQLDVQAEERGPLQIRISNAAGVNVLERTLTIEKGTSLREISLDPSLPRGMYFITTQMGGVVRHFKLMKQ